MPVLWRLLLSWYLKLFALGSASLLCLLMATRLHDIAALGALGMSAQTWGFYALCQIPSILPLVVAFSAFIAPLLMGRFLLKGPELTALAACRIRLREIIYPIMTAAICLSLLNFYFVSELATAAHLTSRQIILQLQKTSPLALLKQPHLIDRGHFAAFSQSSKEGLAEGFVFVFYQAKQGRLSLIKAEEIGLEDTNILARNAVLIGTKKGKEGESLWIENIGVTKASGDLFSWLGGGQKRLSPDHLSLKLLSSAQIESLPKQKKQYTSELGRRIAFALAPFSLSLLGLAYALTHERRRRALIPSLFALVSLALIFVSKSFFTLPILAWSLQIGPQILLIVWSLTLLRLKEKGRFT